MKEQKTKHFAIYSLQFSENTSSLITNRYILIDLFLLDCHHKLTLLYADYLFPFACVIYRRILTPTKHYYFNTRI